MGDYTYQQCSGVRCQQPKSTAGSGVAHVIDFLSQVLVSSCSHISVQVSIFIDTLYETSPKWHGLLMIRLVALAVGSRTEQRTAEYRLSKCGIALRGVGVRTSTSRRLRSIFFLKIDRIHSFDIRYSLFQGFFFDLTGHFFGRRRR